MGYRRGWGCASEGNALLRGLRPRCQFTFGAIPILFGASLRTAALLPILVCKNCNLFPCGSSIRAVRPWPPGLDSAFVASRRGTLGGFVRFGKLNPHKVLLIDLSNLAREGPIERAVALCCNPRCGRRGSEPIPQYKLDHSGARVVGRVDVPIGARGLAEARTHHGRAEEEVDQVEGVQELRPKLDDMLFPNSRLFDKAQVPVMHPWTV